MSKSSEVSSSSNVDDAWMTDGTGHPRRWAILAVLMVSLLIVVLDNTVLNIALPTIQQDLQASQSELVWAVDSYIVVFAALLYSWGVLGDRFGRKRILIIGLVIFGIASAASAFATSPEWLVLSRGVMGIGGAAVMPVTLAIITVVFPPAERGRAIGIWAAAVGGAVALGPVLGGLLLQHPGWTNWITGNDWGAVFLINVPVVIAGLIGVLRIVPETRNPEPQRLDLVGLVLSFVGMLLLVYGIIHSSAADGWIGTGVLAPILGGAGVIALFLFYEARSDHKSFDVSLFRNRGYSISLSAVCLAFFALMGLTFTLPFYLQIVRGLDTLNAGLAFIPFAVGQLISAPRSAKLVERFGYRVVMSVGLIMVSLVLIALTQLGQETNIWWLLFAFFIFGLGMGSVISPATSVMQNALPLSRAGAGSAVQNTVRQLAGALGVAIAGSILGNRYAENLAPSLADLPPEFPAAEAEESVVATDAILNGLEQQGGIPTDQIESLRQVSYEAFISASHAAMLVSTICVIVAVFLVLIFLPKMRPPGQDAVPPPDTWEGDGETTEQAVLKEEGLESDSSATPTKSPPGPHASD